MSQVIEINYKRCGSSRNGIRFPTTSGSYSNCDSQTDQKLQAPCSSVDQNGTPPWPSSMALSRESTRSRLLTRAAATATSAAP